MKSGEILHIRLNPEDVMGCIDVVKQSGIYVHGMSLAQIARLALSGLLEAARKHNVIPTRDGYEYNQMVQPILATGRNGKKLQVSSIIQQAEAARAVMDLPRAVVNVDLTPRAGQPQKGANDLYDDLVVQKGRLLVQAQELAFKRKADPENFSKEEIAELAEAENRILGIDQKLEELGRQI